MSLSLESIYKPLNDFFLNRFGTAADSPVCFRFDKINSQLSDADCIDPHLPPPGYSPALAVERWSTFVNGIPVEDEDGINVVFTNNAIDSMYGLRLLGASLPYLAPGADETAKENAIAGFSLIKSEARKQWDQINSESLLTLGDDFKPSQASPQDWYVTSNAAIWTSQSFHITDPSAPAPASTPQPGLWRLKIDDATLQSVAARPDPPSGAPDLAFRRAIKVAEISHAAVTGAATAAAIAQAVASPGSGHSMIRLAGGALLGLHHGGAVAEAPVAKPAMAFALHDDVWRQIRALDVPQRRMVAQYLVAQAPTKPPTTPSVSIAFEYCLIRISRPWWMDAFVNDQSWCVPGVAKGQFTSPDRFGATLPLLPIAAVAVRNLNISGNWTTDDVSTATMATDFGPFKVDGGIVNNSLSHAGIQVVGWLMQRMPPLPPNDPGL